MADFSSTGKNEPDSKMMDFYSMAYFDYDSSTLRYMKMNDVRSEFRRSSFEIRVNKWLKDYIIENYQQETVMICIAPGHEANDRSSFMYQLIKDFICANPNLTLEDGSDLLIRYKTIEKQATAGSNRSEENHRDSIKVKDDSASKDKVVIILDDVWTTGCTLRVCEEKVRTTGPKDVKLLAIGRTV